MLAGVIGLTGCGNPNRINFYYYNKYTIYEKSFYSKDFCNYTIKAERVDYNASQDSRYILPNNFGEVGYVVTVTNGIQAWKP